MPSRSLRNDSLLSQMITRIIYHYLQNKILLLTDSTLNLEHLYPDKKSIF